MRQQKKSVKRPTAAPAKRNTRVQGEGDYDAARRYRRGVESFVATADIDRAAHEAAPRTRKEAAEMDAAEAAGRSRARGTKRARKTVRQRR
jgi:hypothetical protein